MGRGSGGGGAQYRQISEVVDSLFKGFLVVVFQLRFRRVLSEVLCVFVPFLGSLWGSLFTFVLENIIFLGKAAAFDFERQYIVLCVFSRSGPPGKQKNDKKRIGEISSFFTYEKTVPGSILCDLCFHLGFSSGAPGSTKYVENVFLVFFIWRGPF